MSYDKEFRLKYRLLLIFNRKFGTTNIPSRPGKVWMQGLTERQIKNLQVTGRFVETLRAQYRKQQLAQYKVDMLDHIGFEWVPKSKKEKYLDWKGKMSRLMKFKERYGHCNVPENWENDGELAAFVVSSRMCYSRRKLSDFKILALEELNFDWAPGMSGKKRDRQGRFINSLKQKPKIDNYYKDQSSGMDIPSS